MERAINPKNVVRQYREVVGSLDLMFKEIGQRSESELWRFDGVGSCKYIDKTSSEIGLESPYRKTLIRLRDKRNRETEGRSRKVRCPYHRIQSGCVLGDLKAPYCIAHVDYPGSLQKKFKIDGYQLKEDINWILEYILGQETTDEEFYQSALGAVHQMTAHIKSFPMLELEDRRLMNGYKGVK